jgi:hypothetical protein
MTAGYLECSLFDTYMAICSPAAAHATFTTLVDSQHTVSSAFQILNVPTGISIDERGRVVRPAEPAWTSTRTEPIGDKVLLEDGDPYVAALRDRVLRGDESPYSRARRATRSTRPTNEGSRPPGSLRARTRDRRARC